MRKYIVILIVCLLSFGFSHAQFFQGTFGRSGNSIVFKMKPSADITTSISYIEFSFRYITSSLSSYTISNFINGMSLPGLNLQRRPNYVSGEYTYIRFVHNSSTIINLTYIAGVEYELCRFDLSGASLNYFEMASDLIDPNNEIVFGVADGNGNFISPLSNNQLFGPGFNIAGNMHILPISELASSLDIIDILLNVSIQPNPIHNTGIVNIKLLYSSDIYIKLLDVSGKTIMKKTIAGTAGLNSMPLDMTLLATGNYFLSVKVQNKTTVISVMKGN